MSKEEKKKEKPPCTQDFITFKPEPAKFLSKKDMALVKEHRPIIKALRSKNMTVKEMHDLYYDTEKETHIYSIKTIYRYLEKLEKAGLVAVAGYRITEGIPLHEKLFCRTANLFYEEFKEDEANWWKTEKGKTHAQNLSILLSELFQVAELDESVFYEFFKQFAELQHKTKVELFEKTKENKKLAGVFSKIDLDKINELANLTGMLTAFLRQPELLAQLQKLLKRKP